MFTSSALITLSYKLLQNNYIQKHNDPSVAAGLLYVYMHPDVIVNQL